MGTRSLTVVHEDEAGSRPGDLLTMYRQYDGHPTGHGKELADFLSGFSITNGLCGRDQSARKANGMGCLAAQIVAHFKTEPGNVYLYPPGVRDLWEEYIYTISLAQPASGGARPHLRLVVQAGCVTFFGASGTTQNHMPVIFDGQPEAFDADVGRTRASVARLDTQGHRA